MPNTKSPFAGIKDAEVPGGGAWIPPGVHDEVKILAQRYKSGFKGRSYITEFELLSTQVADAPKLVSWVVKLPDDEVKRRMGLGNIKGFLAVCLGVPEDDITEEIVEGTVDGQNRLAGTVLKCIAVQIPTRTQGQVFTKCTWTYVRGGWLEREAQKQKSGA